MDLRHSHVTHISIWLIAGDTIAEHFHAENLTTLLACYVQYIKLSLDFFKKTHLFIYILINF